MLTRRVILPGLILFFACTAILVGGAMKEALAPPDGAVDLDAKGWVKIKAHKKTGDLHLFAVKINKVDRDAVYGVFIGGPAEGSSIGGAAVGSAFEKVGEIKVKGRQKDPDNHEGGGSGKLKINTRRKGKKGGNGNGPKNGLTLGDVAVTVAADLYGRAVEVRDAAGAVVLTGTVPAPVVEEEPVEEE